MKKTPKVALLIETSNSYARELLHGVRAWVRENGPWSIRLTEQGRGAAVPAWLSGWDGDGVIARVESERIARGLRMTGLPVIDVSAALPRLVFARVATAAVGAAQLAATHLLECGLTNFAYCGDRRFHWARLRGEAFGRAIRVMGGGRCASFTPVPGAVDDEVGEIARWLKTLPRPVGVLACLDLRGQQVLAACRLAGLTVPEEVAVIGVHNDELLCELCDPPLSSVIPNAQRAGYEAAGLLARAMAGKRVPVVLHEVAPQGVAARQSTDLAAVDDAKIAGAVRFMRQQAAGGANVGDVLRAVPMARTALERRFKAALGTTPHAHLRKLRIDRVKELLVSTSLPVGEIATATGFEHTEYLSAMFRRECGVSPREWRAQHRARSA
jgi:LacI family transcriptional regulator